jgi:uncharacterized ion transporter superfamily protein YfcC
MNENFIYAAAFLLFVIVLLSIVKWVVSGGYYYWRYPGAKMMEDAAARGEKISAKEIYDQLQAQKSTKDD